MNGGSFVVNKVQATRKIGMKKKDHPPLQEILAFFNESPTAWHAVDCMLDKLEENSFEVLDEKNPWTLKPGGHYLVTRNGSSLIAFTLPLQTPQDAKIVGSHTDSPAFKLKPNAEFQKENMVMLGLEIYGAPLLTSWLNRDLGIAGRVVWQDAKEKVHTSLVKIEDHPVVIPQLAIHLDRSVNESGLTLNKQEHLAALAMLTANVKTKPEKKSYLDRLLQEQINYHSLLAYDLFVYPLEKARLIGFNDQMISSYRIDSLGSVYAILNGFLQTTKPHRNTIKIVSFWDNEEVGSSTKQGAGSPFLPQVLERICLALGLDREHYLRLNAQSLCLSVDLAHATHPNYPDRHEPRHSLLLDGGVAIKSNAQERYATDSVGSGKIVALCEKFKIPYQRYVARGDIPSGTTIGPIHAHLTGMPTIDIGCAQLSMHSCREIMSCTDLFNMCKLIRVFFD